MSIELMSAVWKLGGEEIASNEKFLLVCLADQANDDGLTVYLKGGIETLATRCSFSVRTCQRLLRKLEVHGWLSLAARESYYRPRQYQLNKSKISRGDKLTPQGVTNQVSRGDKLTPQGVTNQVSRGDKLTSVSINSHDGRRTQGTMTAPPSASPPGSLGKVYQKLADVCVIALPATEKEDFSIRRAEAELRSKMVSDNAGRPPSDRQTCQAINTLLEYWKSEDWRGRKGDCPRPDQIPEVYGVAKRWLMDRKTA